MIFAHVFIGMLFAFFLTKKLLKNTKDDKFIGQSKQMILWATVMLFSVFPDLDLLYVFFIDNTVKHRTLLSHSLVPYTIILFILLFIFKTNSFYKKITLMAYLGIVGHLLADIYVGPIYLLAPFNKMAFVIQPFPLDHNGGIIAYFKTNYMKTEIIIMLIGTSLLIKTFIKDKKDLIILFLLTGIIEISALVALVPFVYSFN